MVRMILRILIPICVVNICFTHSVPKSCSNLRYLCSDNELCVFRNSYSNECDDPCPQGLCLFRNAVDAFGRVRRAAPVKVDKPDEQSDKQSAKSADKPSVEQSDKKSDKESDKESVEQSDKQSDKQSDNEADEKEVEAEPEEKVSDTYLHLHLNTKQPDVDQETLNTLASNITSFFSWPDKSIKDCQKSLDHLTCAVVGLNPVLVSTNLVPCSISRRELNSLANNIDKITPIQVDSVGTSNKNASLLAENDVKEDLGAIQGKMSLSDVMIWVFGAVLLLLLVSLVLVYLVQKRQTGHTKLTNESDTASSSEFYDYEHLVRSRIQEQANPHHRPPNLTQHQVSTKQWPSEEKGSPEYIGQKMDINSAHLALSYMEQYHTNSDKVEVEWERLCLYEPELTQSEVGKRAENIAKNRFSTVMPYDHNRVKLSNSHASDFINASYIYAESPKNPTYIASQGPLQNCTGDFWQMVWEQGVSEIIMLSLNDGIDCYQYWGSDGSGVHYHYQLHLVSQHANHPDYPDYIVRSFYLKNLQTYETRTVTQFHYVAWIMSSSTPRSTQSLLDFRRKVHKSYRGLSAPLLVHCNDGIGRTGTYILLDMTLSRICKGVKEVDMEAAVEHLRDQRAGMVVTKEQYAFALSAVVEEIHNILGELPSPKTAPFTPTMD